MKTLNQLIEIHGNNCCYCGCELNRINHDPASATVEHLRDKWDSPRNRKINEDWNLRVACYKCNNDRGNKRNKIARNYYKMLAAKQPKKYHVAGMSSNALFMIFGTVPKELFNDKSN